MSTGFASNAADLDHTPTRCGEFQRSSPNPPTNRFWRRSTLWLLTIFLQIVSTDPVEAQQSESNGADNETRTEIAGSRLLDPASFGFEIPVANIQPADLRQVRTKGDSGQVVTGKVHVKVGDNYVVMLPDGSLVGRMANQVSDASDEEFEPVDQKELAKRLLDNQLARFSGMKYERSKHYVYLYNTSSGFKDATRRILESMYNGVKAYAGNMGIDTHHPEVPLVVIMFRSQVEFQAYREMPAGVVAYYDMISNHIVLCEESPLANVRPDLAQGQLLSTIAHEGAHQILHNIGVQQRLSMWPMWLSEGIAEFFAPTSFGNRNKWKGAGDVNDLRMFELESFMQTRYLEGFDGRIIREAVTAARLDSTGYATAWSIVHFLAKKKRKQFNDYVSQISQLPPMRGMVTHPGEPVIANLEHFQAFFGEDMKETETELVEYLGNLDYLSPVGSFAHYVGLAIVPTAEGKQRYACFFHTEQKVEQWSEVLRSKLTPEQIAGVEWEVHKVGNRNAANNLIRQFLR